MSVVIDISVSLDGFIARPDDSAGPIHAWFFEGDTATGEFFRTSGADTDVLRENLDATGATIAGRRTYDVAGGWAGSHPAGAPVVVITHEPPADPPQGSTALLFEADVTAAVERARDLAGERDVYVMGGASVIEQVLAAGLADILQVHVAPCLLGEGKRLIDHLGSTVPLRPERVLEGPGATHLRYRVER